MKKLLLMIITLLLAVSLISCTTNSLEDYKKAAEKTEQIKKGRTAGEFSLEMEFNTKDMTEDQIKQLNYFKHMKGTFDVAFDDEAEQGIFRNYMSFGGLGFDYDLFVNGNEIFMKLPIIGKYMRLDELQTQMNSAQYEEMELISADTQEAISEKWLGILRDEDIFKGRDIVLTTPDGEVKTTEYTIKLKDEQIKSLAEYSADILSRDEKLKENYRRYIQEKVGHMKDKAFEQFFSDLKDNMKNYTVDSFSYTGYVDIDGYLVNETVEFSMKTDNPGRASAERFSFRLEVKNWDINRPQQFEFPVLSEENTLNADEVNKNMPSVMEDLFKKKD
jgi:hypothetical protein